MKWNDYNKLSSKEIRYYETYLLPKEKFESSTNMLLGFGGIILFFVLINFGLIYWIENLNLNSDLFQSFFITLTFTTKLFGYLIMVIIMSHICYLVFLLIQVHNNRKWLNSILHKSKKRNGE